jgi:mannose-6-phosphate isomerase-like protein (cupin superfamily)
MSAAAARTTTPYWYSGHLFEFLLDPEETGGAMAILRITCRPGFDPPMHVHHNEDEVFHILEGQAAFLVGDRIVEAGPGETVWLPRGVPHAPRIDSEIVRSLVVFTPGDNVKLFREFSVPADGHVLPPLGEHLPDFEALGRRMGELGIPIVGPPLA